MAELMKNHYYNYASIYKLAKDIKEVYPNLQVEELVKDIMDETWSTLELKARMRKITVNLGKHLPSDFKQALDILDQVIAGFPSGTIDIAWIFFPDFVEVYGQDECNWELSIAAMERYTKISTAEFAVRTFIINSEERMMAQMAIWAKSDNEHVRRLASEGCRPALPWGQSLVRFKKDPTPIIGILNQLKSDPSVYVRKSVANNLNDISKTHPDLVVTIAKDWYGKNENTDWIVKHGCRTLLKKGNREVLNLFGFIDDDTIKVDKFSLINTEISIGALLEFSFTISTKQTAKIRLEYGIDYVKANGRCSRKIFQISERILKNNQEKTYHKTHSFSNIGTRIHYSGVHSIVLIVNGIEKGSLKFMVSPKKKIDSRMFVQTN